MDPLMLKAMSRHRFGFRSLEIVESFAQLHASGTGMMRNALTYCGLYAMGERPRITAELRC
jgi:hypothetical protein